MKEQYTSPSQLPEITTQEYKLYMARLAEGEDTATKNCTGIAKALSDILYEGRAQSVGVRTVKAAARKNVVNKTIYGKLQSGKRFRVNISSKFDGTTSYACSTGLFDYWASKSYFSNFYYPTERAAVHASEAIANVIWNDAH